MRQIMIQPPVVIEARQQLDDAGPSRLDRDRLATAGLELLPSEVRAAREVVSPNVCRIFDLVEVDGSELVSMELIDGETLIARVRRAGGPLQLPEAGEIASIRVESNQISDLSPLAKLENLRSLYLANNKVKELAPIADLKKVHSLYVDGNQLTDIKPLAKMSKLDTLGLNRNQIADLTPLKGHERWKFLFLENNKITDLGVLVDSAKAANAKLKMGMDPLEASVVGAQDALSLCLPYCDDVVLL